jgi:hypothetical protein
MEGEQARFSGLRRPDWPVGLERGAAPDHGCQGAERGAQRRGDMRPRQRARLDPELDRLEARVTTPQPTWEDLAQPSSPGDRRGPKRIWIPQIGVLP